MSPVLTNPPSATGMCVMFTTQLFVCVPVLEEDTDRVQRSTGFPFLSRGLFTNGERIAVLGGAYFLKQEFFRKSRCCFYTNWKRLCKSGSFGNLIDLSFFSLVKQHNNIVFIQSHVICMTYICIQFQVYDTITVACYNAETINGTFIAIL